MKIKPFILAVLISTTTTDPKPHQSKITRIIRKTSDFIAHTPLSQYALLSAAGGAVSWYSHTRSFMIYILKYRLSYYFKETMTSIAQSAQLPSDVTKQNIIDVAVRRLFDKATKGAFPGTQKYEDETKKTLTTTFKKVTHYVAQESIIPAVDQQLENFRTELRTGYNDNLKKGALTFATIFALLWAIKRTNDFARWYWGIQDAKKTKKFVIEIEIE